MEPLLVGGGSKHRTGLSDLAVELAALSAGFRRSLPEGVLAALADLVRAMNCYYSNLIEGHDTHPLDIERALRNDYSAEPRKRDLELEAQAHITVQQWIDQGGLAGRATTRDGIREIHRRFCERLPDDLLWVENPETGERTRVIPGELRDGDVEAARHVPVSAGGLLRFLDRFEQAYRVARPDRRDPGRGAGPSPAALDPPVFRRQRPGRPVDVPRHAAGEPRQPGACGRSPG